MGGQLNIKDKATVELARRIARRRNLSATAVIRDALKAEEQRIDEARAQREARVDAALSEFRRINADKLRGVTSRELMDAIYVDGVPE